MVHLFFVKQVIDVVQGHQQHLILVGSGSGYLLEDPFEGYAAGRRRMIEDLSVNLIEYGIPGGVHLAVDMDGNYLRRMSFNLLEELEQSGGLACARRAETKGIDWPAPLQGRADTEFEAVHLVLPVQEVFGQVI
jgi:hypothetical protein